MGRMKDVFIAQQEAAMAGLPDDWNWREEVKASRAREASPTEYRDHRLRTTLSVTEWKRWARN